LTFPVFAMWLDWTCTLVISDTAGLTRHAVIDFDSGPDMECGTKHGIMGQRLPLKMSGEYVPNPADAQVGR